MELFRFYNTVPIEKEIFQIKIFKEINIFLIIIYILINFRIFICSPKVAILPDRGKILTEILTLDLSSEFNPPPFPKNWNFSWRTSTLDSNLGLNNLP